MAKFVLTLDTESKELVVKLDGETLENVSTAYVYCDDDEYCSVELMSYGKMDNKVTKTTTYRASGSEKWAEHKDNTDELAKAIASMLNK